MLPKLSGFTVEAPNETQIFRALMCLYLAHVGFLGVAAFRPDWQRVAMIWAIFFMRSRSHGPGAQHRARRHAGSRLLNLYLVLEVVGGCFGLWQSSLARRTIRAPKR